METASDVDPWQLRAALANDPEAWNSLVDEFSGTIWQWARRMGLGREDAEDVCQSVWFLLKDRGHTIDDPRRLPGWLATTTRREALAVSKKSARRNETETPLIDDAGSHIRSTDASAIELIIGEETFTDLEKAFDALSEKCKQLLSLLWSKVLSYREVSDLLDMPVGSIGPTKNRCLETLRQEALV